MGLGAVESETGRRTGTSGTKAVRQSRGAAANRQAVNQATLMWLRRAKAEATPWVAYLPQLAAWGLEDGGPTVSCPLAPSMPDRGDVESMLGLLQAAGKEEAAQATRFLLSNPNLSRQEQTSWLLSQLQAARSPEEAAQVVLEVIYDRLQAMRP